MIEERARILSVNGQVAEVETQRSTACGSCDAKGGCGTALLSEVFGKRRSRLSVLNPIQAQPGEQVVIGLREAPFLRAAFALYAVPLLAMIGGALVAEWLALRSAAQDTELASLLGGLLGLSAGLGWLRLFARRTARDETFQAVVMRKAGGPSQYIHFS